MALEALFDQLDPDPKKRGDQFERLCAWYLTNPPEYRGRFKRISLWSEWPKIWGPDAGIDLVQPSAAAVLFRARRKRLTGCAATVSAPSRNALLERDGSNN